MWDASLLRIIFIHSLQSLWLYIFLLSKVQISCQNFSKKKRTRFGTIWWMYVHYSWYVLKGGQSKSWLNYLKLLSDTSLAGTGCSVWEATCQIPSEGKILGFWKKQMMIQWSHQESMFFASDRCLTGIKTHLVLYPGLLFAIAMCWLGLRKQKSLGWAGSHVSLKPSTCISQVLRG